LEIKRECRDPPSGRKSATVPAAVISEAAFVSSHWSPHAIGKAQKARSKSEDLPMNVDFATRGERGADQ